MCNLDDLKDDGAPTGSSDPEYARGFRYGQEYGIEIGIEAGMAAEQLRIIKSLESYFELTQEPNEDGTPNENPEWDRGFQAAMAIIKNPYNQRQDKK